MSKNKNKQHRFEIYTKYNFTCNGCGIYFPPPVNWDKQSAFGNGEMCLEIDHIIPLSKGGKDTIENKQALCQKCNNIKSDK